MRWAAGFILAFSGCGFSVQGSAPDGTEARDGIASDALADGAPADVDSRFCLGAGLGRVCLDAAPVGPLVLPNMELDTGTSGNCTQVVSLNSVEYCVLAATTITAPTGTFFRGRGTRPLILVASQTVTIDGTISVSSLVGQNPGAGSPGAVCGAPGIGEADVGGGAGGAGGSFHGKGGGGGAGDLNSSAGGDGSSLGGIAANVIVPTSIRAGCPGGPGGVGIGAAGAGGRGGGAMYLIAGTSVIVNGQAYAVGQGGAGGTNYSGGGGGGSGGFIGFDAPNVIVNGAVIANGGGGGEGSPPGETGGSGADGPVDASRALGGLGWLDAGNGGLGSGAGVLVGDPGLGDNSGGGGGGGGAGFIYVKGTFSGAGPVSPSPSLN